MAAEPFAAVAIRRLEELRLRGLELAIDQDLAAGRHRQVLSDIDALVAEHPLSERLHALRMLALYRSGRQAEALDAYREARRVLVDEVGIEPGPELRALHERILRQDPSLAVAGDPPPRSEAVTPTNLPAPSRRLFGRERELDALRDMLATGDERLVTLLGLGGTGKTRLAIAAGETLLPSFAGGVWLVPLAGVESPDAIVPAIAAALGVGDAAERSLAESVAERLRQSETLLVLDNFEQLVEGSAVLADLLARSPGTRALVTSQLPLRLAAERVLRLEPLEQEAAIALFAERARAALAGFDLEAEREAVEAICARADNMPLTLELAAARIAVHTAARAARTPRRLAGRSRPGAARRPRAASQRPRDARVGAFVARAHRAGAARAPERLHRAGAARRRRGGRAHGRPRRAERPAGGVGHPALRESRARRPLRAARGGAGLRPRAARRLRRGGCGAAGTRGLPGSARPGRASVDARQSGHAPCASALAPARAARRARMDARARSAAAPPPDVHARRGHGPDRAYA